MLGPKPIRFLLLTLLVYGGSSSADTLQVPRDYVTIQACIDAAVHGDECVVTPGTYAERIDFLGKAITVRIADIAAVATIDGTGLKGSVVSCLNSEGADSVLEGFVIIGGTGTRIGDNVLVGGGMYNQGSDPTVMSCTFDGNSADAGGAIYNEESDPTISNCRFVRNAASILGGGILNASNSSPTVINCVFHGNLAVNNGGGMANAFDGNVAVTSCVFSENEASFGGGMSNAYCSPTITDCSFSQNRNAGMFNVDASPTVSNCIFSGNSSTSLGCGGGVRNAGSNPTLVNCTLSGNTSSTCGGGIGNGAAGIDGTLVGSNPTLINCLVWGNSPSEIINTLQSSSTLSHCCVRGGLPSDSVDGGGNIDLDPLFAPGPVGCFYLSETAAGQGKQSPCVNAGSGAATTPGLDSMTTRSDEGEDSGTVDIGYHYSVTGQALLMGDFDRDGRVDLIDWSHLQRCFTAEEPTGVAPCCRIFDFELDADVDLDDYAAFQEAIVGAE